MATEDLTSVKDLKTTGGGEAWYACHRAASRLEPHSVPLGSLEAHSPLTARAPVCRFVEVKSDYENRRKTLKDLSRQTSRDDGDDTVPAAAAASFRVAANALKFAMTQRSGRTSPGLKRPGGGTVVEEPEPEPVNDLSDEELLSTMCGQWVEVECLLRVQLRSAELLEEARERVKASLAFDGRVSQTATTAGVLKGAVFQALLAHCDGSADATAASVGLDISDAEWDELTQGADALRKLIRIKVQDDNDLKTANNALSSCAEFFTNIAVYAARQSLEETAVLSKLE